MRTGSTVIRVMQNPGGGWDIREPGRTRALAHSDDLNEAVLKARTMMVNGGAIRIVNGEGFLVETRTVPAPGDNPWWYLAPRLSTWVLGVLFVMQGVFGTVTRRGDGIFFWLYVVMGLLGVAYIVQLLVSRRRDRHLARSPG
jgi:hypothetical protein